MVHPDLVTAITKIIINTNIKLTIITILTGNNIFHLSHSYLFHYIDYRLLFNSCLRNRILGLDDLFATVKLAVGVLPSKNEVCILYVPKSCFLRKDDSVYLNTAFF